MSNRSFLRNKLQKNTEKIKLAKTIMADIKDYETAIRYYLLSAARAGYENCTIVFDVNHRVQVFCDNKQTNSSRGITPNLPSNNNLLAAVDNMSRDHDILIKVIEQNDTCIKIFIDWYKQNTIKSVS